MATMHFPATGNSTGLQLSAVHRRRRHGDRGYRGRRCVDRRYGDQRYGDQRETAVGRRGRRLEPWIGAMSDKVSDRALVERVQRGEREAFDLLMLKYQHRIAKLIARYIQDPTEVLDVAQEAFLKAYRALPRFRGDSAFYTWMYRIAINTAKNHLAAQARRPHDSGIDVADAEQFAGAPELKEHVTPGRARAHRRDSAHGRFGHRGVAGGSQGRDLAARARRAELRRHSTCHGVSDRYRTLENFPRPRGDQRTARAVARLRSTDRERTRYERAHLRTCRWRARGARPGTGPWRRCTRVRSNAAHGPDSTSSETS